LDSLQLAYEYKKQEDEFKKNQQNYNSRYLRLKNNL
jgi:translation initiation factor IF-3